jgi:ornithine carbamoyltransferase
MFFEKPSLRTHVTFEAGMTQLGGHAIWLRPDQVGIGTRESPADVAANLSRWVDAIVARTFSHVLVEELAAVATIPVINGLTDLLHPCQVMADFQTVAERRPLDDSVIAYVGDGNNMANSLMLGAAVLGLELQLATPESHQPALRVRKRAEELAARSGARILWTEDPIEAVRGAHFVYTDVWTSMGQEAEQEQRRRVFRPYQLNAELLQHAPGAWVMHCLPAHRGEEITDEVLDGERSIAFDQAENRLHAQKAVLERLLRPPPAAPEGSRAG